MSLVYTVALCTHNHADRLRRTLADLGRIDTPEAAWELLIIDNASSDATAQLLAQHAWPTGWKVRLVREQELGLSNARNRAVREAHGQYVIFIDDDETPDRDWLRAFDRLVQSYAPDAFGGRIRVMFEDRRPPWLTDDLLGFLGELNRSDDIVRLTDPSTSFYGGNFGFRRSVCETIGAFDAHLGRKGADNTGGEEVDFYRRLLEANLSVWWTPEAVIHHRIQAVKLDRAYFRDLHYRQGRMEAIRMRGKGSRIPPRYLYGQLVRACLAVWQSFRIGGLSRTVRREMNVSYFAGKILGWAFGPRL